MFLYGEHGTLSPPLRTTTVCSLANAGRGWHARFHAYGRNPDRGASCVSSSGVKKDTSSKLVLYAPTCKAQHCEKAKIYNTSARGYLVICSTYLPQVAMEEQTEHLRTPSKRKLPWPCLSPRSFTTITGTARRNTAQGHLVARSNYQNGVSILNYVPTPRSCCSLSLSCCPSVLVYPRTCSQTVEHLLL